MAKDFTIDDVENEIKTSKRRSGKEYDAYDVSSTVNLIKKYQDSNKKGIDSVTRQLSAIAKEQAATAKVLRTKEIGYAKGVKEVENSMAGILKRLGFVVDDVSKTAKKILVTTAVTTKDAVTQMARNMNADFQFNKANYVGIMLSKASPIFGYFASKFMETNVFSSFIERIKENFRDAADYGADQLKKKGIFGLLKDTVKLLLKLPFKAMALPFKIMAALIKAPFKLLGGAKRLAFGGGKEDIPQLQKGGYVKKGGLVNLHAGEVVTPLKKFTGMFERLIKEITITRVALAGLGGEFAARFGASLLKGPVGKAFVYGYGMLKKWGGDTLGKMKGFVLRMFGIKGPSITTVMADLKKYKDNPAQLAAVATTYIYEVLDNIKTEFTKFRTTWTEQVNDRIKEKAQRVRDRLKYRNLSNLNMMNPYAPLSEPGFGARVGAKAGALKGKARDQYNSFMASMYLMFSKKGPSQEQQWNMFQQSVMQAQGLDDLFGRKPRKKAIEFPSLFDRSKEPLYKRAFKSMVGKGKGLMYDLTKPGMTREQREGKSISDAAGEAVSFALYGKKKPPKKGLIETIKNSYQDFRDKDKREKIKASAYKHIKEAIENPKSIVDKVKGGFGKLFTKAGMFIMMFLQKFALAPFKIALAPFYLIFKAFKVGIPALLGVLKFIGKIRINTFASILAAFRGVGGLAKVIGNVVMFAGKLGRVIPAVGLIIAGIQNFALLFKGLFKAKSWFKGESLDIKKLMFSMLGAVLGGTGSGVAGAKSGAIRYAMMGAGLGIAGGPLGMLAGAGIGAMLGAVLGAVGGERIAKILDVIWTGIEIQFIKTWKTFTWPFKVFWDVAIKARDWILEKIKPVTDFVMQYLSPVVTWISDKLSFLTDIFKKVIGIFKWLGGLDVDKIRAQQAKELAAAKAATGGEAYQRVGEAIGGAAYGATQAVKKFHTGGKSNKEQFAILEKGEVVVPKNVVLKAAKSGVPPQEIQSGAALADRETGAELIEKVASLISKMDKFISAPLEIAKKVVSGTVGFLGKAAKVAGGTVGTGFGWLSRMFESGGAGPGAISSGKGDYGGKSYGLYQFASKTGGASAFVNSNPWLKSSFAGLAPGSAAFDAKWKSMAADPNFEAAQHSYVRQKYLEPLLKKVQATTGLDLSKRHPAVLEELLSTAVQYGPATSVVSKALAGATNSISDSEILMRIGKYKYETVSSHFRSSSPEVQRSVANRFRKETSLALSSLPGQMTAANTLPKAQTGGYIGKTGPIFAHAGEVIGPLNDIKEIVKDAMLSRGELAKKESKQAILQNELIAKSQEGLQSSTLDLLKQGQTSTANMINNFNNIVSNAMTSRSGGGNQAPRDSGTDAVLNQLITGDFT